MRPIMPKWVVVKSFVKKDRYKWLLCVLVNGFAEDAYYEVHAYYEYEREAFERLKELYAGWKE